VAAWGKGKVVGRSFVKKEDLEDLLDKAAWVGSPFKVRARLHAFGLQELVIRKRFVKTVAVAARFRIVHAHRRPVK
jgi:hypothetical protein